MKVGIFGAGKLSKALQEEIKSKNEEALRAGKSEEPVVVAWVADFGDPLPVEKVDVAVDASVPTAVKSHIEWAISTGVSLVVATTGWSIDDLEAMVGKKIGLMVSPNFSLGVAAMKRISSLLGVLVDTERSYEAAIFEHHHKAKVDAPSGTAISLANAMAASGKRYSGWQMGHYRDDKVMVSSLRSGQEVGLHEIIVESPLEEIRVIHRAKDRKVFALGIFAALKWMKGKKGLFSMDDLIDDILRTGANA